MNVHGLLLAAGAGRRMGTPKALMPGWLVSSVACLREGGCDTVSVVLGASAEEALRLLPPGVGHSIARGWEEGMGASLRAGLTDALATHAAADAVLVHLVDLPDVTPDVVGRVLTTTAQACPPGELTRVLARASYGAVPGHPVLLGRDHWPGVIDTARGDQGARAYLKEHDVALVECGDLASGRDQDTPTGG